MSTDSVPVQQPVTQNFKPDVTPLFSLGRILATPAALALMEKQGVAAITLLSRHQHGDWGDINKDDSAANIAALRNGSPVTNGAVSCHALHWL